MRAIQSTGSTANVAQRAAIAVKSARRPTSEDAERPPGELIEGAGEGEEHHPDHDGDGGGGAEVPEVEDGLVGEEADRLGGVPGATPRQEKDRVEDLEGVDQPQQDYDRHEGREEGSR